MAEHMQDCEHCSYPFSLEEDRCPHCARPGLFPNVRLAGLEEEQEALSRRHEDALQDAEDRGCRDVVDEFERHTAGSQAVIARSVEETMRLACGDNQIYTTFHQLSSIGFKVSDGSKWDPLRRAAEVPLFGAYTQEIRFAALTLDGTGVLNYGDCCWILREDMIAHRTSVFEENVVQFMERHRILVSEVDDLPKGYRAPWDERSKVCVAKLASKIDKTTRTTDFQNVLIRQGKSSEDDEFVEAHVGGPITVRTFDRVIINSKTLRSSTGKLLKEKLKKFGVTAEGKSWKR